LAGLKHNVIRAGLEGLYFSGAHMLMRPFVGGMGMILMLHHVRPPRPDRFQPNRLLEVTPYFLEKLCRKLRRSRLDIITLDEMHERLVEGNSKRRFVCVTFDDGYRDNLQFAYPILKKYEIPFGLYIPTSFPDRLGELWWLALEAVIAKNDRIGLIIDGKDQRFDCRTVEEKRTLYASIYDWLRRLDTEEEVRRVIRDLSRRYQVDIAAFCEELCMTWDELARMAFRSAGHHRGAYGQSRDAEEGAGESRAYRNGNEPIGDRRLARGAAAASGLSGGRRHLRWPAGISDRPGTRLQDRGDDAARRRIPAAPRSPDGAAAHFGERRIPAHALPAGADVGRGHRPVERFSPRKRA
jgi:peptidoglycan/xylan/chitin deacetylase (PgdA/CDA1 family)